MMGKLNKKNINKSNISQQEKLRKLVIGITNEYNVLSKCIIQHFPNRKEYPKDKVKQIVFTTILRLLKEKVKDVDENFILMILHLNTGDNKGQMINDNLNATNKRLEMIKNTILKIAMEIRTQQNINQYVDKLIKTNLSKSNTSFTREISKYKPQPEVM